MIKVDNVGIGGLANLVGQWWDNTNDITPSDHHEELIQMQKEDNRVRSKLHRKGIDPDEL